MSAAALWAAGCAVSAVLGFGRRRSAARRLERRLQDAVDTFSARVDTTDTDMGDVHALTKRLNYVDKVDKVMREMTLKLRRSRDAC